MVLFRVQRESISFTLVLLRVQSKKHGFTMALLKHNYKSIKKHWLHTQNGPGQPGTSQKHLFHNGFAKEKIKIIKQIIGFINEMARDTRDTRDTPRQGFDGGRWGSRYTLPRRTLTPGG